MLSVKVSWHYVLHTKMAYPIRYLRFRPATARYPAPFSQKNNNNGKPQMFGKRLSPLWPHWPHDERYGIYKKDSSRIGKNVRWWSYFVLATALEYAVSMHTKRGELSRKKKALDTIGQLEINTNNSEEILKEAKTSRRSAFMRYLASLFI